MAITIGSDYIASSTTLDMQPGGNTSASFRTDGIRNSNNKVPAFYASGSGGWYYRTQMGGNGTQWYGISGWTWTVNQQGAGAYGFDDGRYYAPVTGRYYFYASSYFYCDDNATDCYIHFMFGRNGSRNFNNGREPYSIYAHGTANNHSDGIVHSTNVYLTEGQYFSIQTPWAGGESRAHGDHTLFCGCLMG